MHDSHIVLKVVKLMLQFLKKIGAIHVMLTNNRAKFMKSFLGGVVNLGSCWVLINNKSILKPSFNFLTQHYINKQIT